VTGSSSLTLQVASETVWKEALVPVEPHEGVILTAGTGTGYFQRP